MESAEPQEEAEETSEEVEGEDEESEEKAPRDEKFVVKVDGKEIEVPKDELIRGYQREADYTRKTQKLAEERKLVESEFQQVRAEREAAQAAIEAARASANEKLAGLGLTTEEIAALTK